VARATDVVARLGGDEFGILGVEMASPGTEDLVARIEAALRDREIKASTGWAVRDPRHGIGRALEEADSRMYHFKKTKKD
jgi:GGDEF domain-containing protein